MKLSNTELIDLLAAGHNGPEICQMRDMKIRTFERRMERLRAKHKCKTVTQLVVKLKLSGVSTTDEQPNY
jgi:DNA-binding CsgD family transcriptional regulator